MIIAIQKGKIDDSVLTFFPNMSDNFLIQMKSYDSGFMLHVINMIYVLQVRKDCNQKTINWFFIHKLF